MHIELLRSFYRQTLCGWLVFGSVGWWLAPLLAQQAAEPRLSFRNDVRPILSNHCFACHGPDAQHRQADLRLDVASELDLKAIEERITSTDPEWMMPPPEMNKPLKPSQVEVLKEWLQQGAPNEQHWAFITPQEQPLPELPTGGATVPEGWDKQPIDRWVLASLHAAGLTPAVEADKRTLIRRLKLDLTGLPPTLQEIDDFLSDTSETAYEALVERLLREPAYGEHMARYWLDLVRFADTNGLHHDHYREVTPYRDWVIRAFNDNLPYDRFITDQLAGDVVERPTTDQLVASGFNRLHLIIDVGTALPEESFFRNVVDQVSAVGTAFMGLTLQCAVCHDHKYDPITQKDFYQLSAFFNNFDGEPETGRRGTEEFKRGLQPPYINLPSPEQTAALQAVDDGLARLEAKLAELTSQQAAKQQAMKELPAVAADKAVSLDAKLAEVERDLMQHAVRGLEQAVKSLTAYRDQQRQAREALLLQIPATLVMKERAEIRPAYIMVRGEYDHPGEQVQRQTPGFLPAMQSKSAVATRLDLARWLTDPAHPLTARVAVNRIWQQLFGVGLVKTSEDFGAQGEAPSHPELLDYLALQFIASGWDVKELMRSMVLSQTYRQASQAPTESYERDPRNRLLARGSRYRLDAEVVRDQILSLSGLLNPQLYGRSVKPPQPPGLWETVTMPSSYPNTYQVDAGDRSYRRSLYTFWKRAMPPPQMSIFDAPARESCIARRERTNTPLQALLLMNEEQMFAAARHLAAQQLPPAESSRQSAAQESLSDGKRIARLYAAITAHEPDEQILQALEQGLREFRQLYQHDQAAVAAMLDGKGASDAPSLPAATGASEVRAEWAAWTMLVHSLLNLDLTKTRE